MSAPRARYDGPFEGVEVHLPDGQIVIVKQNHLLPDDVPAAIRDEMLSRQDWSKVAAPSTKKED